jgi:hypothetical protein
MSYAEIGHNAGGIDIEVEVRVFNSIQQKIGGKIARPMTLPAGGTVGDILSRLKVSAEDVFLVWCNGRDITRDLNSGVNVDFAPEHGDVIAVSGAVPYSWGFGSPIV